MEQSIETLTDPAGAYMEETMPSEAMKTKPSNEEMLRRIINSVVSFGPHNGVTCETIFQKTNKRAIVESRQIAMYFCKEKIHGITWKAIGIMFKRDHSTAMHAHDKINNICRFDRKFAKKIKEVSDNILTS